MWIKYLIFLLFINPLLAQTIVVLGGGGARAGVHLGVLEYLEEQAVPIDYIIGNSMGALIGAFYASGYSIQEIKDILIQADWEAVFSLKEQRDKRSFKNKREDEEFLLNLQLGVGNGKVKLPLGMVSSQYFVTFLEDKLTALEIDFDQLPIPFRAVATDIGTGESIILDQGSLAEAVIISMTVPGLYTPVKKEINGEEIYLIDGGVANNIPINAAKALNKEAVIIAVNSGTNLKPVESISSFIDVLRRTIQLMSIENTRLSLQLLTDKDVLIEPDLNTFDTQNYDIIEQTFAIGYAAAAKQKDKLQKLAISKEKYKNNKKQASFIAKKIKIDSIEVTVPNRFSEKVIRSKISIREGEYLDPNQLRKELNKIYGYGYFETIDFALEKQKNHTKLKINAKEKDLGNQYLRFGLRLEDNFAGRSHYTLGISHTLQGLNALGGEWKNTLTIGNPLSFTTELYQPIDFKDNYFIKASLSWWEEYIDTYLNGSHIQDFRQNSQNINFILGRNIKNQAQVAFYLDYERGLLKSNFQKQHYQSAAMGLYLQYDSFDNLRFPKKGFGFLINWRSDRKFLGADENFDSLYFQSSIAKTFSRHTIVLGTKFASTLEDKSELQNAFSIGGFLNLSGYQWNELTGSHIGLARFIYYYHLNPQDMPSLFKLPVYAGFSIETGNAWQQQKAIHFSNLKTAGSIFIGLDTLIGPVYIAGGLAEHGFDAFYLFLGQPL